MPTLIAPFGNADWLALAPVLVVAVAPLVVLLADLLVPRALRRTSALALTALALIVAGIVSLQGWGHPFSAFGGGFQAGGFTIVFQEVALLGALLSLPLAGRLGRDDQTGGGLALLLWSTCGALLMAGASNLLTIFLGLELLSLALYCLCALAAAPSAREAALKYLILSSTASGFMLYGMALLFGATGSAQLAALATGSGSHVLLALGSGLFLVGFAFKLSLVPFHVWTPDVYEGAPLPITAFMSVVTKAGALAVLARFAYAALPQADAQALLIPIWVIAALSMIGGNVGALAQTDMKRLLAYSGIAQVGYVVAALAGTTPLGLRYAMFYLVAYAFMNLGAFGIVGLLSRDHEEGSRLTAYAGLGHRRPFAAAAMTFFLLALAGLPPTAGFTGKLLILASSVDAGYGWLAGVLIAGTAISIYVYAKIIYAMYARRTGTAPEAQAARRPEPLRWLGVGICAVAVFVMAFYPLAPSDVLPQVK
ncbi:MAG: NADH-quinone oxidoreductase subunit N [Candidatus Eremiobacteraeota bacterium]|nr:NADH-quinone oxidoreductase subunit N [Candidatus Eremiobacteraeota bacterium]